VQAFFDFFASVFMAIRVVLTLDPAAAQWFKGRPITLAMAATVAVLAGASTLLGDSVVLFLNRIRGWRFAFTLFLNGVAMVLLYALQAVAIFVIGALVTGKTPDPGLVLRGTLLSTAPMVFGFLALIPYLGPAIARLLQLWGLLALWIIVEMFFLTALWESLVITLVSWGIMQVLSRALARPVSWVGNRAWRAMTGQPFMMTGRDLLSGQLILPLGHEFEEERR
jgi:hypothetical protein